MASDESDTEAVGPLISMTKRRYSMVLKAHNQVLRVSFNTNLSEGRCGTVSGLHKLVFLMGRK